jgi:hypothetical protein
VRFWIREGDALPVIKSVIIDSQGAAVDLTTATGVVLEMRNPSDGTVFATHTGAFEVPRTSGGVKYQWSSVDTTGNAGEYAGHWVITWTGGALQSFPTDSAFDIIIASATGFVGSYGPDILHESRLRSGETGDTSYTDEDIAGLLASRNGDTAAVAYDIWSFKASDAANLVDMSEAGSSRSLGALYRQCLEMAQFWGKQSPAILESQRGTPKRGARTRAIERA